eukprot:TRINITY_DN95739_c0_g1_i1.p1 TRINITY_DN95739_c0_g1~~TRINITY_DN95739_c0_g1_i1.p1  ORF type:complete len:330 (-),score=91.51 TRINITY_DN95739_c0_g1_i1:59-1048(-)
MDKYAVPADAADAPGTDDDASKSKDKIKALFHRADCNGDGAISCQELGEVMRHLGENFSDTDLIRIFTKMDRNHDSRIQFAELIDWIFGFADLSDATDLKARAAAQTALVSGCVDTASAKYQQEPEGQKPEGLAADFQFELEGEEPDLPDIVSGMQMLSATKLRALFQNADVSKRGHLLLDDIRRLLFPDMADSVTKNFAVVKVFAQMDKNGDGKIHCGEFVSYIMRAKQRLDRRASDSDKRHMASAFSMADADHNGTITVEEFEKMFGAESASEQAMLHSAFSAVDVNGDGSVSMTELAKVYGKELVKETKGIEVVGSMNAGDDEDSD